MNALVCLEMIRAAGSGHWIEMALCAAVLAAGALEQLVRIRQTYVVNFAPDWIPFLATGLAKAGLNQNERSE